MANTAADPQQTTNTNTRDPELFLSDRTPDFRQGRKILQDGRPRHPLGPAR